MTTKIPPADYPVILDEDILTGRWAVFRGRPGHGWIAWSGGPPHVQCCNVDVRLRSGRLILYRQANGIGGRGNPGGNWIHLGERSDIIAYRRHDEAHHPGDWNTSLPF